MVKGVVKRIERKHGWPAENHLMSAGTSLIVTYSCKILDGSFSVYEIPFNKERQYEWQHIPDKG